MSKNKQTRLFADKKTDSGPVTCLGMEFESDKARLEYFSEELRKKLQDPEFRAIEGFPLGEDEDILALSDPPYYTACPNPWVKDFIEEWENQKPETENQEPYHREPFAADVKEGKNDPIYNAHSYHTKVPHKAIMRYILHYTEPGDIIFDGFCGTGMTGVAAQMCGDRAVVESLGYQVKQDGTILQQETDEEGKTRWVKFSKLGVRRAVLNDLSPAATFITQNYLNFVDLKSFANEALQLVDELERSLSWVYQSDNGKILSAVWSDVFICPTCSNEIIFWEVALKNGKLQKSFPCPQCNSIVGKSASKATGAVKLERSLTTKFDTIINELVSVPKLVLVEETRLVNSKRVTTKITEKERKNFGKNFEDHHWPPLPIDKFFPGRQTNKLINGTGISYVCHMYTPRILFTLGKLWQSKLSSYRHTSLFQFCLTSINNYISRKQGYFGGGGGVSGTLFTPSVHLERNIFDVLRRKINKLLKITVSNTTASCVSTQNISTLKNIPSNVIDYIFTDPPFGESLQYAELNFFIEAWLKVYSDSKKDCVINYVHRKDLSFYSHIIASAFTEYERILKFGAWITIEFHNSKNAVWHVIQQAIESAGLIVADVRILDKKQRSFNAVNRSGAVDQDLIITAYKPNGGLEKRFRLTAGTEDAVWDFVRTHLKQLPVFVLQDGKIQINVERQNFLLFDRMVAFHVQRGVIVPLSASEFYRGLVQRFIERDEMYFLPEQAAKYDKKRITAKEVMQLQLFIFDEASSILWLKQQLIKKPQTFQDIHPHFMQEIKGWSKAEKPMELSTLLKQNFLCYDGKEKVPEQIHAYLSTNWKDMRNLSKDDPTLKAKAKDRWYVPDPNKSGDLEKLRERDLLKEFETYKTVKKFKRTDRFRLEAVRAGFKNAWQARDYKTIITIAEKIPPKILEEDPKLLMWYDQAVTRMGDQ